MSTSVPDLDKPPSLPEVQQKILDSIRSGKLKSTLPFAHLLSFQGHRFGLDDHYFFESLFNTEIPYKDMWMCGRQVGKCVLKEDIGKLRKADGSPLKTGELVPGTELLSMADDGSIIPRRIEAVHDNGRKPVFSVQTRLGASFRVTGNHPLLTPRGYRDASELSPGDRLAHLSQGGVFGSLSVDKVRLILTAYMLGDGSCSNSEGFSLSVSGAIGCEVLQEVLALLPEEERTLVKSGRAVNIRRGSPLRDWLLEDNLVGCYSPDKFLPDWVYQLSRENTLLFLSRLWATDGTNTLQQNEKGDRIKPDISYTSTSKKLCDGVSALLGKLGLKHCRKPRKTNGHPAWVVRVEGLESQKRFQEILDIPGKPSLDIPGEGGRSNRDTLPLPLVRRLRELLKPFHHNRKTSLRGRGLPRIKPNYCLSRETCEKYLEYCKGVGATDAEELLHLFLHGDTWWDTVVSVTEEGEGETFDITVEGEHNFIIDGIVSHNSLNEVGGSVVLAALIPYFKQLVISPRFEQTKRLSTVYYKPFLSAEPLRSFMVDESCEQSVLQKSFRQQSMIFFSYAFTDAERVRGVSADMVWIDEAQDILWDLLPVIMETLSGSKHWGVQRFTGTPKSFANAIHKNWLLSSQGYWTIKCTGCNRENIGSVDDHLLDMIGPKGPVCYHCGKALNSREGYYLHRFPERYNEFRGRNVTQPLHPYHYEHPHRWKTLRNRVMGKDFSYSTAKTYNEVLGASYDSSVKPITLSDIKKAAVGGNNTLAYANRKKKECISTSMGVDWGGGGDESKSYTAVTFQGMLPNGNIEMMFCKRLQAGLSQIEEAKIILELYRILAPNYFAHDFTGGGDGRETILLQATGGSQNLIERLVPYTYSVTADRNVIYFHPPASGRRKSYIIDKPRSLLTMALMLRGGRIILPELESCYGEVEDLLNLSEERQERPRGSDVVLIHKDPETSDDIAHALNFGCSALWYSRGEYPDFAEAANIRLTPEDLEEIDPTVDRLTLSHWTEE